MWWPRACRRSSVRQTAAWVTLVIAARVFSISSLRAGSVVGFLRYTTSCRVPYSRVLPSAEKTSYKYIYIFAPFRHLEINTRRNSERIQRFKVIVSW